MYSPAWGLCWQLWRRHRWGFMADAAWLAFASLIAFLCPDRWRLPDLGQLLAVGCGGVFIHQMAAFSYGFEINLAASQSGFPARMFSLPVETRSLVAWPMALGAGSIAAVWLVISLLILRPCGQVAPIAWPAVLGAAAMMAIQAVAWTPFAFNWARIIVMLPIAGLLALPLFAKIFDVSDSWILAALLVYLPCIYLAGVAAVARARRGDALEWRFCESLVRGAARLIPYRRRQFASAAQAQLWFECRRHAALLPVFMLLMLIPLGLILFLDSGNRDVWAKGPRLLAIVLSTPWLLAGIVGPAVGKHDFSSKSAAMPAFLTTRPISSIEFVQAKFKMAAVSTLLVWLVTLLLPAIWLLLPGNYALLRGGILETTRVMPMWKFVAAVLLVLVLLPAITWKQIAVGLYVGLTGRAWVANVVAMAGGGFLVFVAIPLSLSLQWFPEYRPLAWRLAPWLIAAVLAAKAIAAVFVSRALMRSRQVTFAALQKGLAIWIAITAALATAIAVVAPAEIISVWSALAAAILIVPFNRLAVAPLALNWDRHR